MNLNLVLNVVWVFVAIFVLLGILTNNAMAYQLAIITTFGWTFCQIIQNGFDAIVILSSKKKSDDKV
jgi:hypothetical protein